MLLWLCGFSHFFPLGCCFYQLDLRFTFPNGALCENASSVQWHVEFYAWKSSTKENKRTSKRLIWYPVLKGYIVFETRPSRWSTEPAASTRPVVSLSCRLSGMLLLFFFFLQVLFVSWRALARELWLKTCTAQNCQILFKTRRLAHILVMAT